MGTFIDLFLHLDKHLTDIFQTYGTATYVILVAIVFCETGLVVTPFLPGDSLLFAAGALSASGGLSVSTLLWSLFAAAFVGDTLNYVIGAKLGNAAFSNPNSKVFRPQYLDKTRKFYEKYGNKTIVIARFVPIVRTFAPFLAGVGGMDFRIFAVYNAVGGALWVGLLVGAGHLFAEVPLVKNNFSLVIVGIIIVSILPAVIEVLRERRAIRREG
jgi:membrane-associated protein